MKRIFLNTFNYFASKIQSPVWLSYLFLKSIPPYLYMDDWSILPFNGQVRRTLQIARLAENFKADFVIETGTYLGSSTSYLATLFQCKTYTIEINPRSAAIANLRFRKNHSHLPIEVMIGDSVEVMGKLLSNFPRSSAVFAYLDAHWLSDIPTSKELGALITWGGQWIAVIDDFKVPGDSGYKFDKYEDLEIGLNLIPINSKLELWVPAGNSSQESGVKSGTAYIFSHKQVRELMDSTVMNNLKEIPL